MKYLDIYTILPNSIDIVKFLTNSTYRFLTNSINFTVELENEGCIVFLGNKSMTIDVDTYKIPRITCKTYSLY